MSVCPAAPADTAVAPDAAVNAELFEALRIQMIYWRSPNGPSVHASPLSGTAAHVVDDQERRLEWNAGVAGSLHTHRRADF